MASQNRPRFHSMFHRFLRALCLSTAGLLLSLVAAPSTHADSWDRKKLADKHAPAGIMGDHLHEKGEWMVEYRYMSMYMDGNRIGKNDISDLDAIGAAGPPAGIVVDGIRTNAGATPTEMTMEMHMAHIMYGATDNVTLYTMLMLPSLTMDHLRGDANPPRGSEFTTHNSGFGDTAFGALLRLHSTCDQDLILNLGCTVPTGDIYRETSIPTSGASLQPLPYPMRLGSGTFNARPGITYRRFWDWYSWGAQFQTDLPIGHNYRGYSVSNEFRFNSWTSVLLTDNWSVSMARPTSLADGLRRSRPGRQRPRRFDQCRAVSRRLLVQHWFRHAGDLERKLLQRGTGPHVLSERGRDSAQNGLLLDRKLVQILVKRGAFRQGLALWLEKRVGYQEGRRPKGEVPCGPLAVSGFRPPFFQPLRAALDGWQGSSAVAVLL